MSSFICIWFAFSAARSAVFHCKKKKRPLKFKRKMGGKKNNRNLWPEGSVELSSPRFVWLFIRFSVASGRVRLR